MFKFSLSGSINISSEGSLYSLGRMLISLLLLVVALTLSTKIHASDEAAPNPDSSCSGAITEADSTVEDYQMPGYISIDSLKKRDPVLTKKLSEFPAMQPGAQSILRMHPAEAKKFDRILVRVAHAMSTTAFRKSIPSFHSIDFNGYLEWIYQAGDFIIDELVNFGTAWNYQSRELSLGSPGWLVEKLVNAIEDRIEWIDRNAGYLRNYKTLTEAIYNRPVNYTGRASDSQLAVYANSFRATIQEFRVGLRVNNLIHTNISAFDLLQDKNIPFTDRSVGGEDKAQLKKTELDLVSLTDADELRLYEVKSSVRSGAGEENFQRIRLEGYKKQRKRQMAVVRLLRKRLPVGFSIDRFEVFTDGIKLKKEDLEDWPLENTFGLIDAEGNYLVRPN